MSGIDHLVLCVNDLDAARARYQALGFTMVPKAQHPFGTGNSNIQLQGSFLEILCVMESGDIVEHAKDSFSFSAFNRDFLAQREGFSMLVMESEDAAADQVQFSAHNLETFAPGGFSRQAQLPDGSSVTVGFSLTFTVDRGMPDAGFFTCQQHAPEHFWKPEYQTHANTAQAVSEVAIVSDHPLSHSGFLRGFTGANDVIAGDDQLVVETPRGVIRVLTPALFEERYCSPAPDLSNGARLGGYTITVKDIAVLEACLNHSEVSFERDEGRLAIGSPQLFGVAASFEQIKPA